MSASVCLRLKRLSGNLCNRSSLLKGTKKILPEGGDARIFASRPLRQDHGVGNGALEGRGRSFFISAYFFNNSPRATSSAVSEPIR